MKGDLTADIEKEGKKYTRKLNPDRHYISKDGEKLILHGKNFMNYH